MAFTSCSMFDVGMVYAEKHTPTVPNSGKPHPRIQTYQSIGVETSMSRCSAEDKQRGWVEGTGVQRELIQNRQTLKGSD